MTILELMLVTGLTGILAAIAVPAYSSSVQKLRIKRASIDLMTIFVAVGKHRSIDGRVPDTLAGIDGLPATDPWGNAYVYTSFSASGFRQQDARKDHNLHPINTEFDLYSVGKDGDSRRPLTARPSRDDVIVARDGSFVGLASDF